MKNTEWINEENTTTFLINSVRCASHILIHVVHVPNVSFIYHFGNVLSSLFKYHLKNNWSMQFVFNRSPAPLSDDADQRWWNMNLLLQPRK